MIHVNDYHFIDRMALSKPPDTGEHAVILAPFDDFAGLGEAARKHAKSGKNRKSGKNGKGQTFQHGGYEWGWRGEKEIFPVPDRNGKCVTLTGDQIKELISRARAGDSAERLSTLRGPDKAQTAVRDAFDRVTQRAAPSLPMRTTAARLSAVPGVEFAQGKGWTKALTEGGKPQAFLIGPGGSKDGAHLHLFFEKCAAKPDGVDENEYPITLESYHLTPTQRSEKNEHYKVDGDGGIVSLHSGDRAPEAGNAADEVALMMVMVQLLDAARLRPGDESKSKSKSKERDEPPATVEHHRSALATTYDIRVDLVSWLLDKAGVDDDTSFEADSIEFTLELITLELKLLSILDAEARELDVPETGVLEILDAHDYPNDPARHQDFYADATNRLQSKFAKTLDG